MYIFITKSFVKIIELIEIKAYVRLLLLWI